MKSKVLIILIVSVAFSSLMAAELPSHPLTFQNWKRVQIHDSTKQVLELSNEIKNLNTAQESPEKSSEEEQQILQKQLEKRQEEQKAKLENLQYSKQLNFEDYFDVYLSKFAGDKKALDYIAKRLSKDSVAYLLERSINKDPNTAAKAVESGAATSKN